MSRHIRLPAVGGYTPVTTAGRELEHVTFGVLRLSGAAGNGGHTGHTGHMEAAIIVLTGRCTVWAGSREFRDIGGRASVFDGPGTLVYVPPGTDYRIAAHGPVELALTAAAAPGHRGEPVLVGPADVQVNRRGRDLFQREVHDLLDSRVPAARLLVGETYNSAGMWSSYPPHKHDENRGDAEVRMEELYLFKFNPDQGFGFQGLYTADGSLDEAYRVRQDDVCLLPRGYHPVAAAPGYQLYYLWVMAGDGRRMAPADDPVHGWVLKA